MPFLEHFLPDGYNACAVEFTLAASFAVSCNLSVWKKCRNLLSLFVIFLCLVNTVMLFDRL